jgi:putative DNA primase/helicase
VVEQLQPDHSWKPLFDEARKGHARGWAFVRLNGKQPTIKGWQRGEPAKLDRILKWTTAGHNLGLRTGRISGVVVLDDDSPDGSASAALNLPKTVTVITGSGKRHIYFRAPDFKVGNSVKTIADRIDVRGDGGQVVFVGSIHPDTKQPYTWAPGLSPDEVELAPLTGHLLERLRPGTKKAKSTLKLVMEDAEIVTDGQRSHLTNYVRAAFEAEIDRVRSSAEGERNNTLNKAAFAIGQLVGAGELSREDARAALHNAGVAIGLPDSEVEPTIASGLAAGESEPRDLKNVIERTADTEGDDAPEDDHDQRPVIKVHGGFLHIVTDKAERILLRQRPPFFYQRGTVLVRVVAVAAAAAGRSITRKPTIQEVTLPVIVDKLTQLVCWMKFDKRAQEYVKIDCPERVAMTLASRSGSWKLPALIGVIDAPTLRSDGGVLDKEGFDQPSGLYLALCGQRFADLPLNPSREDAQTALAKLLEVIQDFPFLGEADRSVALAAILTALIRPSLRTAPLFGFVASKMGSGKSLLADVVSLIATGRPAAVMTQGADENEDKKRMLPILAEGDPVAVIDNIERPFGSAALCSILTQTSWRDRVLGKSQTISLPTTNTTWLATGNNVVFEGDITTRTLVCELDPKCERPEERKFDRNLHRYIPDNRGDLVVAGLTVLRAYHVAGRPDMGLPVFGRFEQWSDWVRSALVWLGLADPCITRKRVEDTDPVRAELTQLLMALEKHFGTASFRVADVLALVDPELRSAIDPILATASKGQSPAQRLGIYFQRVERRPEGGSRLMRGASRSGTATWRIERV